MTEAEPRRSGRKTKGQHTRNSDFHEIVASSPKIPSRRKSTAPKQSTPAASSPPGSTPNTARSEDEDDDDEDDDPNAQIRCACGATKERNNDSRMMVQCEGCKVWQHCECLELNEDELDDEDKLYYCEICKPELHEEFLAKVERGEKPWETAKKNRAKKRKGRRSTGARGRGGKKAPAKKKGGKKEEETPQAEPAAAQETVEPEAASEPQPKAEPTYAVQPYIESTAESEPEPGAQEKEENIKEEPNAVLTEEDICENSVVDQATSEQMNGSAGSVNGEDVNQTTGDTAKQESVFERPQEHPQEDIVMGDSEEANDSKAPYETSKEAPMPPPDVPPLHSETLPSLTLKDEQMIDVPEKEIQPPVSPTTPTVSKHRDAKRKNSIPESRAIRRKTTHDSDGDYQSDSEQPQKHRRTSATSTTKEAPKEVKPPRRPSVARAPPPKKPTGPDDITVQSELVEKVDDLRNNARRNTVNFLAQIIQKVVGGNPEIVSEEQRLESYPEKLALDIEHHCYLALWNQHSQPTQQYKLKARGIGYNLPKNPALQSRLLKGELAPEKLVQMKPEEMASEEFQLLAEQVRRESELQNTIVAEEAGPRIRRTHKGEEIVEDDLNRSGGNDEPVYSAARGADQVMEDQPQPSPIRSRAVSQSTEDFPRSPPQLNTEDSSHSAHPGSAPQTPQTPNTAKTPRGRQFSIEGVWNNVNTPEGPAHPRPSVSSRQPPHLLSLRPPQQAKSAIDADIDKLLAEEDHDMESETPPYSPSELTFTDTALPVWRGRVSMVNVSNFPARAHYLGGPENAQQKLPLNDLLGPNMLIDGRIAIDRATEYLCGQKFSNTNEIIMLSIEPEDHIEAAAGGEFNRLFQYFQRKERYGVVGKSAHPAIKDCYLVPIDLRDDMPDFFETLASHTLEAAPRRKRVFAVVFVLSKITLAEEKRKEGAKASEPPQSPMSRTPLTPGQPQQQPLVATSVPGFPIVHQPSYGQPPHQFPTQQSPVHHLAHGNGFHHPYYQPHHQPNMPQASSVKKFNFTPWTELQEALPTLTIDQVNLINQLVARNPAAEGDPVLLTKLIRDNGEI